MEKVTYTENGEERCILIRKPGSQVLTDAQVESSKLFKKLSKDSEILLRSQLNKFMLDSGIWTEEHIKQMNQVAKELLDKENKLKAGGIKLSEARKLALEMKILRNRFFNLSSEKTRLDANTVEGQCENFRFDYIVINCLLNEDGERIFQTVHEYRDNTDDHVYKAADKLAGMLYGLDEDYEKKLPENEFLMKYKFVNDKGELVDKDGNLVDIDGNRIIEEKIEFTPFIDDVGLETVEQDVEESVENKGEDLTENNVEPNE